LLIFLNALPNTKKQSQNTIVELYTNLNASTFLVELKTGKKKSTKLVKLENCHLPRESNNATSGG